VGRNKTNRRSSSSTNILVENNQTINNTRVPLKTSLSTDLYQNKTRKNKRQHSNSFGNQNNPLPRKPGRPKREVNSCFFSRVLIF
jgi:hypothetical protein